MSNLDLRTILGDTLSSLGPQEATPSPAERTQSQAISAPLPPAHLEAAAPVVEPRPAVPVAPSSPTPGPVRVGVALPPLDPQVTALVEQTRAVITGLGRGDGAKAIQLLGEHVERVGSFIIRQMTELGAARSELNRLAGERDRLTEENQQMRTLLRSMLNAVEADKRRSDEAIDQIRERLATILPANAKTASAGQGDCAPSREPPIPTDSGV